MNLHPEHLLSKGSRKILQWVFSFDDWHLYPLKERPYAIDIIKYCNSRKQRDAYAEIGCGLGDILRNVDYRYRKGLDNDINVLKAARYLPVLNSRNSQVEFAFFQFPDAVLSGQFNVLALVNWIHHIEPETLKNKIDTYMRSNVLTDGEMIIDTVQDKAYRHNHDILFLTNELNCSVSKIGSYARGRDVWSIRKLN